MQRAVLSFALLFAACGGNGAGFDLSDPNNRDGDDTSFPPVIESCDDADESRGEGTYYDANGSGNCSFDPSPGDLNVAAMNTADYENAALCGACITATGPKGSITVRVVDRCPGCKRGDVDFSESAFARIADISAGRVPIAWEIVPCPVAGTLRYRFKEGSSEWWAAIQVRNHPLPITKFEVLQGNVYRDLPRQPYNYFLAEGGLGKGPFHVRVTDASGSVIEDDVELGDSVERTGRAQFPGCD